VHGRRAGVDGNGVWRTYRTSELCLELANLWASGDPAAIQSLLDFNQFVVVQVRQGKRKKLFTFSSIDQL